MDLQAAETGLKFATPVLSLLLLNKMWSQRLHIEYRFLALYLIWDVIGAVALLATPHDDRYFQLFMALRFVQWILDVLVTLDLVSVITKRYAGITTMARIAVSACLAIATVGALLSALIDLNRAPSESQILKAAMLADRTISFSVLAFLGLMLVFLLWFPIKLSLNTVAYAAGFIVMFAARFSADLLGNLLGPSAYQALGTADLAVFSLVLIYWSVRITVRNETADTVVGHSWDRSAELRLVSQLESINQSLLRTSSKANPR